MCIHSIVVFHLKTSTSEVSVGRGTGQSGWAHMVHSHNTDNDAAEHVQADWRKSGWLRRPDAKSQGFPGDATAPRGPIGSFADEFTAVEQR